MTTLIKVGCLLLTRDQLKRALDEEMTISQTLEMVQRENKAKAKAKEKKNANHE